jgi:hypothetical protein
VTVAVTVTTVGPDFTQMGSFGTAQMFGESVVASMDRSYILRMPEWARRKEGPVQLATLLDAREFKGAYYIDYCLDKEGEEPRTVYSVVGMGSNGHIRRLYTVSRAPGEVGRVRRGAADDRPGQHSEQQRPGQHSEQQRPGQHDEEQRPCRAGRRWRRALFCLCPNLAV